MSATLKALLPPVLWVALLLLTATEVVPEPLEPAPLSCEAPARVEATPS